MLFQSQPEMKENQRKSVLMSFLLQRFLDALGYTFEPFRVYLLGNELLGNPLMLTGPSYDLERLVVLEVIKQWN